MILINLEKIVNELCRLTNSNSDNIEILCLPGSTLSNHCTLILFDINIGAKWVIKISRTSKDKSLKNEKSEINYLKSNSVTRSYVPDLISYFEINNRCVLVTEYHNGRVLSPKVNSLDIPNYNIAKSHFKPVEKFVSIYYRLNVENNKVKSVSINEIIDQLKFTLNNNVITKQEYKFIYNIVTKLDKYKYSQQHGDLTRHNILHNNGSISIIDWTDTKLNVAVDDILFFITNYFLQCRNKLGISGILQAFNYTFFNKNDYSNLVRITIKKSLSTIGVHQKDYGRYFLIFILNRFIYEYNSIIKIPIENRGHFNIIISDEKKSIKDEILWYHYIIYTIHNYDNLQINKFK